MVVIKKGEKPNVHSVVVPTNGTCTVNNCK